MKNIISSAVILSETKNPVVNISDDKISRGVETDREKVRELEISKKLFVAADVNLSLKGLPSVAFFFCRGEFIHPFLFYCPYGQGGDKK